MYDYCEMCDAYARVVRISVAGQPSIPMCFPCHKDVYDQQKEVEMQKYKYKVIREVNGTAVATIESTVDKAKLSSVLGSLMLEYGVPSEAIPVSDGGSALEFIRETRKGYISALVTYYLVGQEAPVQDSEGICYLEKQGVLSKIS